MNKSALGRGLGSLIPQKQSLTEQVIPSAAVTVREVSVDEIKENPRQPRTRFSASDLEDLIGSIKEHGILQPLVVTCTNGEYELIAGERRLRASRTLGLSKVPVIVREADDQLKLELALIENIQRQDLNAVEEAIAYKALVDEFNLTQDQAAKRVGKSRSTVANIIRLLELDQEMLGALQEGQISKTHARTLLAEPDIAKRQDLFEAMLSGITVREAEARASNTGTRKPQGATRKDPNILAHEKKLREILGTKVDIKEKAGKGSVNITFYSREELMELLDRLIG